MPHAPTKNSFEHKYSVAKNPGSAALGFSTDMSRAKPPRKRVFIGLVTGTAFLLCLLLLIGWIIPYIGFGNIHPSVPVITGIVLVWAIVTIAWGAFGLVFQSMTGKRLWGAERLRGLTIRGFLPFVELFGRVAGFTKADVRRSFIKVNNQMTLAQEGSRAPEEVLILLPHCVQQAACTIRITHTMSACVRCGKCPIASLLAIRDTYGVHLAVATGGSIARRIVVETKPSLIIAVACERDLASGIQDTYPLPTFGILNSRPDGPCKNTLVSPELIESAVRYFLKPECIAATPRVFTDETP